MPYQATTLARLKQTLAARVDGAIFWTEEEARLALNESLRDWNLLVGRWRTRVLLSSAAPVLGVPVVEYTLPSSLTYGMRVRYQNNPALVPTSLIELELARPQWRLETVASGGDVPTLPIHWAPQSLQTIVIWPATATSGVNDILVDGVAATPVLVEDGDFADIGEEDLDFLIVDYAQHIMAFKEGGPRWRATLPMLTEFLQAAAASNGLLKRSQAYRRVAGLDRRRDLIKPDQAPNRIAEILQAGLVALQEALAEALAAQDTPG